MFKETFDLEPGVREEGEEALSVREIPHLPSFTLCTWLRFLKKSGYGAWDMALYQTSGSREGGFNLKWVDERDQMSLWVQQEAWTGEYFTVKDR